MTRAACSAGRFGLGPVRAANGTGATAAHFISGTMGRIVSGASSREIVRQGACAHSRLLAPEAVLPMVPLMKWAVAAPVPIAARTDRSPKRPALYAARTLQVFPQSVLRAARARGEDPLVMPAFLRHVLELMMVILAAPENVNWIWRTIRSHGVSWTRTRGNSSVLNSSGSSATLVLSLHTSWSTAVDTTAASRSSKVGCRTSNRGMATYRHATSSC